MVGDLNRLEYIIRAFVIERRQLLFTFLSILDERIGLNLSHCSLKLDGLDACEPNLLLQRSDLAEVNCLSLLLLSKVRRCPLALLALVM